MIKKKKTNKPLIILIAAVLAVLVVVLVITRAGKGNGETAEKEYDISDGVAKIESLEALDPDEVQQILRQMRKQELQEQCEERIEQLESGGLSVWSQFEDYVMLGDSRVTGFYLYDYLPEEFIIAQNGATLYHLEEHLQDIYDIAPANIFISYSVNDIGSGFWNTPEAYVEKYSSLLEEIHAQLPDAKCFIGSILPCYDPDYAQSSEGYTIEQYNEALDEMCGNLDYCYFVDCTEIAEEHQDCWYDDGVHFDASFYSYWATQFIMAEYTSELDLDEDA